MYWTFFTSVCTRGNFSPARKVRSTIAPESSALSFVRTKAPPLPGFTCWNSTIRHTLPSSSMCIPFLKLFVSTTSAIGGECSYATWTRSFLNPVRFSIPSAVTTTSSSIRTPKRPSR